MKKNQINFKKFSFIITGLISAFLIIFALTYSLSSKFIQGNIEQSSLNQQQQSQIKPQADASTSNSLNDLNIGASNQTGTSLANTPIVLSDGSYIVTTNSGIAKLSPFATILYSYSFTNLAANKYTDSFLNYKARQVVQNYLDPSLFYLLIYSPDVIIDTNASPTTWKNPGYVLTLKDSGSNFTLLSSNVLLLPAATQLLSKVIFSPKLFGPGFTDTDFTAVTNAGSSAPGLNDKWTAPTSIDEYAPGVNYDKNVIDNLYLNNLNNMVFINNVLFIYGGNNLPNFWFWSFNINTSNNNISTPAETSAKLYLTVGVNWPSGVKYQPPLITDPSDSTKYLKIKDGGTGTRADPSGTYYYPAYFVAGAKTIAQNRYVNGQVSTTTYSIQTMFVLAGYTDLNTNALSSSTPGVYKSAFINMSYYKAHITEASSTLDSKQAEYFLLNMNSTTAYNFVNPQPDSPAVKLFDQSTYGIDTLSLNLTSDQPYPDGYKSTLVDKIYGFDIQTIAPASGNGLDSVNALILSRDKFSRIIYDPSNLLPVTTTNSALATGANLVKTYNFYFTSKNKINQSNTQQIIFADSAWYLLINNATNSSVVGVNLSGSYVPVVDNNQISPPSEISLSFESINALQGSKIFGLLPVSNNFVYTLNKDDTTKNTTVNLFRRNSSNSPYMVDNAYVYNGAKLPTYAGNTSIWGTITLKDNTYLNNAGYFSNTASEIASNPEKLQNIINFTPAWPGQVATVTAPTTITDQTQLPITINVEYFNNKMYNNQSFNQSLGFPDTTLTGLSSLPSWVIPVAVGVSIGLAAIILILGLSIGIPMAKNKKFQDRGFAHTFKKVDTLTSAVGSVYKKIITETSTIKKKPQMLKSATPKPVAKPAPGSVPSKVSSPVLKKPSAPTKAPLKKPTPPPTAPSAPTKS